MTIAVDFDGTIVEHRYPKIGAPIPFAIETLAQLIEDGHKVILWTVREGELLDEAVEYLRQNGVEPYAVNSSYPNASWSGNGVSRKLTADVYIDDRNLGGLPDWGSIYEMISSGRCFPKTASASASRRKKKNNIFRKIKERCMESRNRIQR